MNEIMAFGDNSGDKKYFTIIPNFIANHSSAIDQSLYLQMKKHAGESGVCFVSEKTFREKMKIGRATLKKSIEYLLSHKWIEFAGEKRIQTAGGWQLIRCYRINDIWQTNNEYYKGVSKRTPLRGQGVSGTTSRGVQNGSQGVSQTTTNKIPEKKKKEEDVASLFPKEHLSALRDILKGKGALE